MCHFSCVVDDFDQTSKVNKMSVFKIMSVIKVHFSFSRYQCQLFPINTVLVLQCTPQSPYRIKYTENTKKAKAKKRY